MLFRWCLQWTVCWLKCGSLVRWNDSDIKPIFSGCVCYFVMLFSFSLYAVESGKVSLWVWWQCNMDATFVCHLLLQATLVSASLMWWTLALEDQTWSVDCFSPFCLNPWLPLALYRYYCRSRIFHVKKSLSTFVELMNILTAIFLIWESYPYVCEDTLSTSMHAWHVHVTIEWVAINCVIVSI